MKIIIAPDSYKGSLTAMEAAKAMEEGVKQVDSTIETVLLPVADGGEGTMESLIESTNGKYVTHSVTDPLERNIDATYGVLGDGETAVIEIAEASGLTLLSDEERNPIHTSTFGTGQLIRYALEAGFRKFIIGLGGSATNDGGLGILQALGMKFLNEEGKSIGSGGGALKNLYRIDDSQFDLRIFESQFIVACDVDNPFVGENGASHIFGPQKGADLEMANFLDQCLLNFANIIEHHYGISLHHVQGAGAAGGVGGAFKAFFPSEMETGIEVVLEAIQFKERMAGADFVITGEGKTDLQTLSGKAPLGIAKEAKKKGIPVILISGLVESGVNELESYFDGLYSVMEEGVPKEESIRNAKKYLIRKTGEVVKSLK
ncbi:glycerate kinase [Chungangia koreensis]|uniref:Glycerate kinase n=1 Tax=Chungangia koreensis TaxID=752657 RepID=A0ABV8X5I5_9LACT